MKGQTKSFRNIAKKALSIVIAFMLIMMTLPTITVTAAEGDVTGNPAFRVTAYDTSARIEIPYISGATTYTVYSSTHSDADLSALTGDVGKVTVFSGSAYLPTAYATALAANKTYYFYLVTYDSSINTLQSTFESKTWNSAKYWTDPGNYDLSWYGDGSASSFSIGSARQLAGLAVLVNGLNGQTAVDFSSKTINLTASPDMSAYLMTPIGTFSHPFKGSFNGGNYVSSAYVGSNVVKGLHTNDVTKNFQGLFGYVTGSISNIGVVDSCIEGNANFAAIAGDLESTGAVTNCFNTGTVVGPTVISAGGIVGYNNYGSVSNCYNTGTVMATGSGASEYIGGVAGHNLGTVTGCYNTGSVTAAGTGGGSIGGVIGRNDFSHSVTDCYNAGTVSYTGLNSSDGIGGVFGQNQGTASRCYNIGAVSGTAANNNINVGGVVGYGFNGSVSNCYNIGTVGGTSRVGGVLGTLANVAVSNSYNAGIVSGNVHSSGAIVGYEDTTGGYVDSITNCAYLFETATYGLASVNGVDQTDTTGVCADAAAILTRVSSGASGIWAAAPTAYATGGVFSDTSKVNGGYPVLLAFGYTGVDTSIDSEFAKNGSAYLIKNAYQLDLVRNYCSDSSKVFQLANNIDISPAQYGGTGDWQPIGTGSSHFTATINGSGFSVSGIYINSTNASPYTYNYGLIGYSEGTVKNLGVTGGSIRAVSLYSAYAAAVVAYNYSGTVSNCYNTCPVTGNQFIGGIAGRSNSAVAGSFNAGPVSGTLGSVGGVAGMGDATGSYNMGSVYGTDGNTGGVTGNGNVTYCYNMGTVTDTGSASGIGGVTAQGNATYCYNMGTVTNTGLAASGIGGVTGQGFATSSYNTGAVMATGASSQAVGGISGESYGTVSNCYNTGAVSAASSCGGITGSIQSGSVSNSYYYGCAVGVGGTGASQTGTTPLVQMSTSPVTVGDSVTVTQQTSFDSGWLAALGADFSVGYAYNSTPSADTSITGNTIQTIQADANGAAIGGTITITQNALTSTGFDGPAMQIAVPLSLGTVVIQQATPTITVDAISPQSIGDKVTLKATLTGGYNPTGTVFFYDGAKTVGMCTVSGGVATSEYYLTSTSGLSITAVYFGDLNNVDATSTPAVTANVSKRQPTLTLTASPVSPGAYHSSVTFTATLSNVYTSASGQPVKITVDGSDYNLTTASDGTATYTITPSAVKSCSVSASYAGDTNNNSAASANLSYDVGKGTQTTPTIGLTGGGANVTYGYSNATYTATASGGESSGAYQYRSSNSSAVEVNSATGALTVKDAGTATIYVKRLGDTNYNDSAEDGVLITVAPRTLDATITPNNKQYDGSDSATVNGSIVYSGVIGSDEVFITGGTLAFSDKTAADNKTVTASGYTLSGIKASDYTLGTVTVNNADITKKTLTVSVSPVTIRCGEVIPALTVNVSGFVTGESASNVSGFTAPTASQNYGSTAVPVAGASLDVTYTGGNPTNNYSFSCQNSTTLTIQSNPVEVLPSDINDGAPTANIQGQPADIGQAALSDDDKQKLADGSEVSIYLRVEKISAAQADQAVVASALNGSTLGQYLDVSLIKNIDGTESNITQTSTPLRITFNIPGDLLASGRTFSIIRVHDGVAATLPDLDSNPDTITIETDRFSTYAIAYAEPSSNPKTGDQTPIIPIAVLGFGILTTALIVKKCRFILIKR